jgi:small-conductance mechanosensitive channel/CRP-like cAMP-binding protein
MELATSDIVMIAVAFALVVLTRVALPQPLKRLARGPAVLLVLHLVARSVLFALDRTTDLAHDVETGAFVLILASIGRGAVLVVLEGIVGPRLARPLPKIFRDIIQSIVYVVLLFFALHRSGVEPSSILTTSALLTAAIALSLQQTLGNLVAGLSIQMQRPFEVDDWIQFDADNKHIGRVLEINWRATKVLTLDDVEVIVPNATLATAPITNFTKPTVASRRSLYVQVPASVDPALVREAVLGALPSAHGVLATPPPTVVLNQFVDGNAEYWIRFHTELFHQRDGVDSAARERVWYAFARADIPIAAPNRATRLKEISADTEMHKSERAVAERERALASVDFLRGLEVDQRRRLADGSRIHRYGAGEAIVEQGDTTAEMFIVQSGKVSVVRQTNGKSAEIATLGTGEFFGEMALMTGEQRTATVRAVVPSVLIGVAQDAVKALLDDAPELATTMSRAIAERQAAMHAVRAADVGEASSVEERSTQLLGRIRRFFAI